MKSILCAKKNGTEVGRVLLYSILEVTDFMDGKNNASWEVVSLNSAMAISSWVVQAELEARNWESKFSLFITNVQTIHDKLQIQRTKMNVHDELAKTLIPNEKLKP